MNRTLAGLALPLLAAGALSCSRGGGVERGPIRFWHAMGGALGKPLEELVAEYNAGRAIPVESVSMGQYEALSQKLMAAVAAGGPPDIGQCYESWTANLAENGSLAQLSAFVEGPNGLPAESVADVYGIFLDGARHGGVLWSFPFNKSVRCLYYNRDMFREAGLDPDAPPRTWEEYRSIAARLAADRDGDGATDRWGLASEISVTMFENLIVQAGGSLLN
ncbi:MAG: extracellular solute-binding protein, partial [bacterium]